MTKEEMIALVRGDNLPYTSYQEYRDAIDGVCKWIMAAEVSDPDTMWDEAED